MKNTYDRKKTTLDFFRKYIQVILTSSAALLALGSVIWDYGDWRIIALVGLLLLTIIILAVNNNVLIQRQLKEKHERAILENEKSRFEKEGQNIQKELKGKQEKLEGLARDLDSHSSQNGEILQTLQDLVEEYKKISLNVTDFLLQKEMKGPSKNQLISKISFLFIDGVEKLKILSDKSSAGNCQIQIKLIESAQETKEMVYGFKYNRTFNPERKTAHKSYEMALNRAFHHIFSKSNTDLIFEHDNLQDLASKKGYDHPNPNWARFFNACMVQAMILPPTVKRENENIIGFLCVDNYEGGFEGNESLRKILSIFSEVFVSLVYLRYLLKNEQTQ